MVSDTMHSPIAMSPDCPARRFARCRGREPEIGTSADKGLTRLEFGRVYPRLHSSNQYLLMDVGLVEVYDILDWKTEIPGIAPIGPVLDLYDNSLSLKLPPRLRPRPTVRGASL